MYVGALLVNVQSQEGFRSHVKNSIVLPDIRKLVSDMQTAIQATNVILDTGIILKEPIPGYNNILLTANSNMNFGLNLDVNRI